MYRGTDAEMLELARRGDVPKLPDHHLPEQARLQAILDRALCVDPAARFQSAAEMLDALDHYALSTALMASQLRFGAFLTDHFADEIVALRRARERAAELALHALDVPVAEVEPVSAPSEPPIAYPSASQVELRRAPDSPAAPKAPRTSARTLWLAALLFAATAVAAWLAAGGARGIHL
jgi:hypothetical protein